MTRSVAVTPRVFRFLAKTHDRRSALCKKLKLNSHKDPCLQFRSAAAVPTTCGLEQISYLDTHTHGVCWNTSGLLNKCLSVVCTASTQERSHLGSLCVIFTVWSISQLALICVTWNNGIRRILEVLCVLTKV